MAKQKDYLADLLADEDGGPTTGVTSATAEAPSPAPAASARPARGGAMTLLGRESALARVASGEVRQVTQLLLDPARVRVWAGNARIQSRLDPENTRDLIDSILAEGGQKVPVIVRRISGDAYHEHEVIAGTRRHFAISWLKANNYPEMKLLAQVADLDDEAAFRLADIENRARKDVSDIERARNYAAALSAHYGGHLTRMAERLKISKGWLSKMLKVANLPDDVLAAFASLDELKLKPAYPLAQAFDDKSAAKSIRSAARYIVAEQADRRKEGQPPLPFAEVLRRLIEAPKSHIEKPAPFQWNTPYGRPALTVLSSNRQGVTLRLHAGSGADRAMLLRAVEDALDHLDGLGRKVVG